VAYYDRADWHYGGDYPSDLPPENGGTHIGMFLAWAIVRDLEGRLLRENSANALAAVKARRMTGREFFFSECDEKFWAECLNEAGAAFAAAYYEPEDGYLHDYEMVLGSDLPSLYHVADTWENFDKISRLLDKRYQQWKSDGAFSI